jgi:hypothetical protein
MYVIDGIAYAGVQTDVINVKSVRVICDYKLIVTFSTGEKKLFDFADLLSMPCYKPLKDKAVFDRVYVDYGTLAWNDGEIDIAPETLYENGKEVI